MLKIKYILEIYLIVMIKDIIKKDLSMLRQIIRPTTEHYDLLIPKEYINQEIEIMVLPLFMMDKPTDAQVIKKDFNPKQFYGITTSSKNEIDEYLSNNKNEWE